MTLERQKGDIFFECDNCGEVLDTDTGDFDAARNIMKREAWATAKVGDVWCHYCAKCKP